MLYYKKHVPPEMADFSVGTGVPGLYRIFIVEDDGVIAGAVARHLEGWGYQVACARRFDAVLAEFVEFGKS